MKEEFWNYCKLTRLPLEGRDDFKVLKSVPCSAQFTESNCSIVCDHPEELAEGMKGRS